MRRRSVTNGARRCIATTDRNVAGRAVAVAGGGIAGLAVAIGLARAGARVTVHEQAAAIGAFGAGLQITPNGMAALRWLGCDAALQDCSLAAAAVEPHDGISGRRLARFPLAGQGPYRFVHRADLIGLLRDHAVAAGVAIRTGSAVTGAGDGTVRLAGGPAENADLVIGADGIHSVLRPILNGGDAPFFTGQSAWRAVVAGDHPPVARIWIAPGRHVVTYPLPGGRINIVAVREQSAWQAEGWNHPDDPAALCAAFADCAPALRDILTLVTEVRLWGLFRHPVAARWHGPGLALLGDGAHPTLPFLAQGANLAIEDAAVLSGLLARLPAEAALPRYQALRQGRVTRAIAAANANARNYHLSGASRRLAHLALSAVGLVPGLFLSRLDWLYGHDVAQDIASEGS